MRAEILVSEMAAGSWFFQKDCTLQVLVVQSFESLLKFLCYSQRYFSLLGWQLCANLNLNMLITFKTLQQQTFKLEIDDTATLGTKINKSEGSFDLHLYSLWIRVSSLSFNHQILHRATKEHRLSFISCNVFVCVCKIMRGFFLKMFFRRHALKICYSLRIIWITPFFKAPLMCLTRLPSIHV